VGVLHGLLVAGVIGLIAVAPCLVCLLLMSADEVLGRTWERLRRLLPGPIRRRLEDRARRRDEERTAATRWSVRARDFRTECRPADEPRTDWREADEPRTDWRAADESGVGWRSPDERAEPAAGGRRSGESRSAGPSHAGHSAGGPSGDERKSSGGGWWSRSWLARRWRLMRVARVVDEVADARGARPVGPPIEQVAGDLRRLNRLRESVATRSRVWFVAVQEAYDEGLRTACAQLGIEEHLDELSGIDLEVERLRVEGELQRAGLVLRNASAQPH